MSDELKRDAEIGTALRRIEPDPPFDSVDWEFLHAAILRQTAAGDEPAFAAVRPSPIRRRMTWLDYTARWARAAIPITALVTVILVIWLQRSVSSEAPGAGGLANRTAFDEHHALSMVLSGDVTDHEVVDAVTGPTSREWLLYDLMENR